LNAFFLRIGPSDDQQRGVIPLTSDERQHLEHSAELGKNMQFPTVNEGTSLMSLRLMGVKVGQTKDNMLSFGLSSFPSTDRFARFQHQ